MRQHIITLLPLIVACAPSVPSTRSTGGSDPSLRQPALDARPVRAASNPILSDGADYSTDPAPLVAGGKLYILTGRDTAGVGVNDFKMPEWQLLERYGDRR